MTVKAAGVMFIATDGRVLLLHRKDGEGWAFPGGGIEEGETPEQAARRELEEETGQHYEGPLFRWTRRIKDDVDFTTFLARIEESSKFKPKLNDEHDSYLWIERGAALENLKLHPGVNIALAKLDFDELSLAKALQSGELAPPARFDKFLLVPLRITGTGASYRPSIKEFVWREPKFYLNDEFLTRCQGLPVVLEHPSDGDTLGDKEFHKRIVGTIMLPYINEGEVWGIARIYDAQTIEMMETKQLSTSPMVETAGARYQMAGGDHLLIEGNPELIDSVAIVPEGVWDKGGEPSGVANEVSNLTQGNAPVEVTEMAEMEKPSEKVDAAGDVEGNVENTGHGEKLDKILGHLDSLHVKHDALMSKCDALEEKHGALAEKLNALHEHVHGKADGEEEEHAVEEEGEPTPLAADSTDEEAEEAEEERAMEGARADESEEGVREESSEEALEAEREENELKRNDGKRKRHDSAKVHKVTPHMHSGKHPDAAARAADEREKQELRARIAQLEKRIPVEMPEETRQAYVAAQAKAERIAQAFGDSAPRWVQGETLDQYRRRLLGAFKQHSASWKDIDVTPFAGKALDKVESDVYADAWNAAIRPASIAGGGLRMVEEADDTGRKIRKFYGDAEACWAPFKLPARLVSFVQRSGK
jgi:8-oxo-dGTP pyrophosphatase MutT (NUDIX family)